MTRTTAAGGATPGRRAPAPQYLAAVLHINCGTEGRQPSAYYECHRCGYRTQTFTGRGPVAQFTASAAAGAESHRTVCPALQENQ
ncbi:hypothetical protein ACFV6Z_15515 [Streptomyces sp. NPDC059818]|uniref:hypothetical protein n=1 Tax=Streptomyces sp. NPDC059818 TaxID=3346962 RepID=UPI0036461551